MHSSDFRGSSNYMRECCSLHSAVSVFPSQNSSENPERYTGSRGLQLTHVRSMMVDVNRQLDQILKVRHTVGYVREDISSR